MKTMPKLYFRREDIILNTDEKTNKDALLLMAVKGSLKQNENAMLKAKAIKTSFDEEQIGRALFEAAKNLKSREKARRKRKINRELAWRMGYYIAVSLGTSKNYPMEP
ncbi:MAG: hypothetical protein Q4E07_03755 [Eubacteriales bacterium]|nr:hypothetical protein [Eubacteriales bacterium]